MISERKIVLDANILIRALLGRHVRFLLSEYQGSISFNVPVVCIEDARRHIESLAVRSGFNAENYVNLLNQIESKLTVVGSATYESFEPAALLRISVRDESDWPIVATALLLNCPIWTEDADFFGCGIATWTSDRVEIFLRGD